MGQYYKALTIDNNGVLTVFEPDKYGSFFKLTEHSWIGVRFTNAVLSFIKNNPKKVAWIGDYFTTDDNQLNNLVASVWKEENATYPLVFNPKVSKRDLGILKENTKKGFLINHTKKLFIDMVKYIKENTVTDLGEDSGWCMNPLPLLTACGNGQGGGDYFAEPGQQDVGSWAFNLISYSTKAPTGYTEVMYGFKE